MKNFKKISVFFGLLVLFVMAFSINSFADSKTTKNGIDYAPVYNASYYKTCNPDVAKVYGNNETALFNHFLNNGMKEGRTASENFSFSVYYNNNADLRKAYGTNRPAYYKHFILFGNKEGRTAVNPNVYAGVDYSSIYNFDYYQRRYPNLKKVFGDNKSKYIAHFVNCGMNEGRRACDTFDVSYYKSFYLDLKNAYGDNNKAYYLHYLKYGKKEHRTAYNGCSYGGISYDAVYNYYFYKNKYPDLRNAFGDNIDLYIKHFAEHGMKEGRTASQTFELEVYKKYTDLYNAYGDNNEEYYRHYVLCGYKEGRKATSFMKGIDVSVHNSKSPKPPIDWQKVKDSGIEFAIIRLGYGDDLGADGKYSQDDAAAIRNMEECERLSIPYGVYLYSYAVNTKGTGPDAKSAESEAIHLKRVLGDHKPALGIWYDVEDKCQFSLPNEHITNIILTFFDGLSDIDVPKGIYANLTWWRNKLKSEKLNDFQRWVAQWNVTACGYQGDYTIWQYTSDGAVNGINGRVDMNYYYLKDTNMLGGNDQNG